MKHKNLLLPLATMLISGISVYANAQLVTGIDPIVQTTVKNGLVGIMIIASMLVSQKLALLKQLTLQQWFKLLLVALVGGSVSFGLFFTGLKQAGAVEGALIHKTMVLWIALLAVPYLKEKLSPWMILGAVGLYLSNFIGGAAFKSFNQFQLLVLSATLLWSVEAVIVKKYLSHIDVDILLFGRMGLGSGLLLAYTAVTGKLPLVAALSSVQWQGLVLVSLLLFGYVMTWYRSLQRFSPVLISSILVGATVITTALTSLTTGKITSAQLLQSLCVSLLVGAIITGLTRARPADPAAKTVPNSL